LRLSTEDVDGLAVEAVPDPTIYVSIIPSGDDAEPRTIFVNSENFVSAGGAAAAPAPERNWMIVNVLVGAGAVSIFFFNWFAVFAATICDVYVTGTPLTAIRGIAVASVAAGRIHRLG